LIVNDRHRGTSIERSLFNFTAQGLPDRMFDMSGEVSYLSCDKRRILITDDEMAVREIFRLILSHEFPDCIIDLASNGLDAVQSFRKFHQSLLLMDLKMPLMDGRTAFYTICDLCDENGWEKPAVIFCTGLMQPSEANIPVPASPKPELIVLQKPVTRDELLAAVTSRLA